MRIEVCRRLSAGRSGFHAAPSHVARSRGKRPASTGRGARGEIR